MPPQPLEKKPSRLGFRTTRYQAATNNEQGPATPITPARCPAKMLPVITGKGRSANNEPPAAEESDRSHANRTDQKDSSARLSLPDPNNTRSNAPFKSPVPSAVHTIQAFLRIRPPPSKAEADLDPTKSEPYLMMQGDKRVLMKPPVDPSRPNALPRASQVYSFDKVFAPATSQSIFFAQTTLPLVQQVLNGESSLLFAYGVSNSGKTYTIQGEDDDGVLSEEMGLIPRSLDVVFQSIAGREIKTSLNITRQQSVEILKSLAEECTYQNPPVAAQHVADVKEDMAVPVDCTMEYAVFVCYFEVHNERIFDLLEGLPTAVVDPSLKFQQGSPKNPAPFRPQVHRSISKVFGIFGSRPSIAPHASANGGTGVIQRHALALRSDPDGGKYVSGLKQVRVRTREEALAIFRMGQIDRQVFGTCMNRSSSRSHGVFEIKVVQMPKGKSSASDARVARLSIVDLAGSERNKNSQTSDGHLREAANINTSLMTLGLCMETLRSNQALAQNILKSGKRKPAVVPFNHSKITQIFQAFFVGEGRAAMIVHINPYDTGFEENSHVMRFSATAREIQAAGPGKQSPSGLGRSSGLDAFKEDVHAHRTKVSIPVPVLGENATPGGTVEQDFEVEEIEPEDSEESDTEDCMVLALIAETRELRARLAESERRNSILEAEIRQEVVLEMNERICHLTKMHEKRLMDEIEAHEELADRKIDILHRRLTSNAFATPAKKPHRLMQVSEASDTQPLGGKDREEGEIEASLLLDTLVLSEGNPNMRSHSVTPPPGSLPSSAGLHPADSRPFDPIKSDTCSKKGLKILEDAASFRASETKPNAMDDDDDIVPDYAARYAATLPGTTCVPAPDEKDAAIKKRGRKLGKAVVPEEEMI